MSIQYNQIICDLSRPLEPLPTGQNEVIRKIAGIRAVFFDIYGTLAGFDPPREQIQGQAAENSD